MNQGNSPALRYTVSCVTARDDRGSSAVHCAVGNAVRVVDDTGVDDTSQPVRPPTGVCGPRAEGTPKDIEQGFSRCNSSNDGAAAESADQAEVDLRWLSGARREGRKARGETYGAVRSVISPRSGRTAPAVNDECQ